MKNKNILIIPIWLLYDVETIEEVKLDKVLEDNIKEYDLEKRKYLYSVLESISESTDFMEILNNIPTGKNLEYSNKEIYEYLTNFKKFMKEKNLND
ncbi:hypothetical protein AB832_01935 [Flavobacteriaceae bacterium (ex Bugula neritina AB1)]|nr:hypothetical protein AB832_01935 [Flavobacteriaceae bacterium (ex Bugula neritina AB1)]